LSVAWRLCSAPGRPASERLTARGQRPSPARARTPRGAAILSAFCVRRAPDEGQAAHGWPGQQQPIRPPAASLPSSCRISSRWRAAGTLSTRGPHPNRVHWASRANACVQPGSCRAANADGPAGRDGRTANERARGRAAWPLAQVARRALSDGRGARWCIGTCAHPNPSTHHLSSRFLAGLNVSFPTRCGRRLGFPFEQGFLFENR
jgi:hypothetical protein